MVTPSHVFALHRNVRIYEDVIDTQLESPWTDSTKKSGKKVSLRVPSERAAAQNQPSHPSSVQEEILFAKYTAAGWVIKRTGSTSGYQEWLVQFPAEKS